MRLILKILDKCKQFGAWCMNKETKLLTHIFIKTLYKNGLLSRAQYEVASIEDKRTHPNAVGFDVKIEYPNIWILAEVKSVNSVNPSQKAGIIHDLDNLVNGKNSEPQVKPQYYYKFMVLRDNKETHKFISRQLVLPKYEKLLIQLDRAFRINDLDKDHIFVLYI